MDRPVPTIAELVARQERVEREVAELRRENDELRARRDAPPSSAPPPATPDLAPTDGPVGRRQLLRKGMAVAGAAAAGAVLLDAAPAAADDGDFIELGSQNNSANVATGIGVQGTTAGYGFGVTDNGYGGSLGGAPTLLAHARKRNFDTGLKVIAEGGARGISVDGSSIGIYVESTDKGIFTSSPAGVGAQGVSGSGIGVDGESETGVGVVAFSRFGTALEVGSISGAGAAMYADRYALRLGSNSGSRRPPVQDTVAHDPGELVEDDNGDLWLCTVAGTPGTWRKVGGPATAGAFHALSSPARVYDSRPFTNPSVGPKTPLTTARTIDLKANTSGVPAGATAVMVNLLLVNATAGNGNLTIWANGAAKPAANTLVWGGNAGRFSTLAVTTVDAQARCQIDASLRTDIVVDIVGYYR